MQPIIETILTHAPTVLVVLGILLGTLVIARQLRVVTNAGAVRMGFPTDIAALAGSGVFAVAVLIGISIALAQAGWSTAASSFIAGLGLGGVVVALAIQDIAKAYTAGIMLLYYRPYQVGDDVTIAGQRGVVTAMRLHVTILRTPAGQTMHIPSSAINGSAITNHTRSGLRRLSFALTLPRTSPFESIVDALPAVIAGLEHVAPEPAATVTIADMRDAVVTIQLTAWCTAEADNSGACRTELILAVDAYLASVLPSLRANAQIHPIGSAD
ncbi:MAG: hypothetical protein RLZZ297_2047 [Chloroflexota bacterium]|jgi:small conductance mechanosensitive channel